MAYCLDYPRGKQQLIFIHSVSLNNLERAEISLWRMPKSYKFSMLLRISALLNLAVLSSYHPLNAHITSNCFKAQSVAIVPKQVLVPVSRFRVTPKPPRDLVSFHPSGANTCVRAQRLHIVRGTMALQRPERSGDRVFESPPASLHNNTSYTPYLLI